MRYPVGKNKEDFERNWYVATGFGVYRKRGRYYHNGVDLNLKTGGNTDLGEPLYAVADGRIVYYHKSHPSESYGLHMVLEVDTPEGKRWFHYAHCRKIIAQVKEVKQGEKIGELGNTGLSTAAHLHFACFKVDPATLPKGIETIAKTKHQLNQWWEDPLVFIRKYLGKEEKKITIEGKLYEHLVGKATKWDKVVNFFGLNPESGFNDVKKEIEKLQKQIKQLEKDKKNLEKKLEIVEKQIETNKEKAELDCKQKLDELRIRLMKDFELKEKQYKEEIAKLKEQLKSKEVVVEKRFKVPKEFRRRFILALEILLGVYDK